MLLKKRRLVEQFRQQWGRDPNESPVAYMTRNRLEEIRLYYQEYGKKDIDDITWSDLDMDEVFFRINHTRCFAGEQFLYLKLHEINSNKDLDTFEKLVSLFYQDEEGRLNYEYKLSGIGKVFGSYYLPVSLKMISFHEPTSIFLYRVLQILFVSSALGLIVLQSHPCAYLLVAVILVNLIIYIVKKSQQENMFYSLYNICAILRFCRFVEKNWPLKEGPFLHQLQKDLKVLKMTERTAGSFALKKAAAYNDPQNLLADYIWGVTLVDLVAYEKILRELSKNEEAVLRLFNLTGMIDTAISCASFRKSIMHWCVPSALQEDKIHCKSVFHPLIKDAIPNDIELNKTTIITGANASGKSTFMKAIAVNVILAQTINTCTAMGFGFPPMGVISSMAVRDDVVSGESFYIREVKYMKRMISQIEQGQPMLLIIDEIMKGTNQKESLAISQAILHYFVDKKCFVVVATHEDILVGKLKQDYQCYYFDCRYRDKQLLFDFKIRPGFGGETNAVKLLKQFDYPDIILNETMLILGEEDDYENK